MATQFNKGGQVAWFHDEGHSAGFFHTFDRLQVAGLNDAPRKVHVFVPHDYETSAERYPVIYMNDGNTAFFPGGPEKQAWHMAELLSDLYRQQQIRKVIVVAIYPLNREREYTHAPIWQQDCCGVDAYSSYVANCVKPFIDQNYRTLADARNTMALGSSHGGLAAFYLSTHYPDQFRLVAAFSPSFWVGLDSMPLDLPLGRSLSSSKLIDGARPTLQNAAKRLKIYLDWGLIRTGGQHNSFIEERTTVRGREMRDLLQSEFRYQLNQSLFVVEDPNGDHREGSWSRRMPNVLKIFFGS
ncbi:alpha/beta hydrolase-fold protein [Leptolyngbya sp. FACHB-17]|uniref:alpha/beta hydrolase n=1 Tax=unclassified Leptolyngbya TaxID=2650499 RepID=UPI001681135F|nr:alpha/beta hydrolase-fold protein [Leptolyngbya sp. FACHB-17]MBD2079216.1 alpha/beta hydrolase [Leptolyngbya sp. FACHB-17]